MKAVIFITLYAILSVNSPKHIPNTTVGRHQLTLEEAEQILGESAVLKERTSDNKTDYYVSKTTFLAKEIDAKSQKQANLYYMVERFKNEEEATKTIQTFIKGNQEQKGFELLNAFGDEAFFHTNKDNFCLLVIRKSNKMIRIKVNKLTSKTSFEQLRKIGKDLIERV